MKNYFKVAGILGAIALICSALIALINMATSPIIQKNDEKTVEETYSVLYDKFQTKAVSKNDVEYASDSNGYITNKVEALDSSKNVVGYIYTVSGKNSYGGISLMVGIEKNGNEYVVCDVEFLSNTESFASTVNSHLKSTYPSSKSTDIDLNPYGKNESVDVGSLNENGVNNVDVKCGATYGATLIKNMVSACLSEVKEAK